MLALRTKGRKQEFIKVAMMMMTKLDSYSLDRDLGFMKLIISSTTIPKTTLLRAEATEDTIRRALFIRIVRFTLPHAVEIAESKERMFYSQKQYRRV